MAIARAVLWNSKLVILDEPTAALGVAQTEQVLKLVRRLAENGLAVVLITHNMNDVFQVADNIACLYLGQMAAQVRAKDVNNTPGGRADHGRALGRPRAAAGSGRGRRRGGDGMSTPTEPPVSQFDIEAQRDQGGLGQASRDYWDKVKGGDLGLAAGDLRRAGPGRSSSA